MLHEKISLREQTVERPSQSFWNSCIQGSGRYAYAPIVFVLVTMFVGASWQFFWIYNDAARYQCDVMTFWFGGSAQSLLPSHQCWFLPEATKHIAAFHLLPQEYPPLTLAPFSLALLAPVHYYQVAFALLMVLVAVLIYTLLLKQGPAKSAFYFALYLFIGAWGTALGRFDLLPASLTLLAIILAGKGRWTWGYVLIALATLLKIYPILLFPIFFIAEQRSDGRLPLPGKLRLQNLPGELKRLLTSIPRWHWLNTLIFFVLLLGITGLFALIDFKGAVLSQINYFAQRPIQIESTGSIIMWIGKAFGLYTTVTYTFGSINVNNNLKNIVAQVSELFFLLGVLAIIIQQWRGKLNMLQGSIAIILVFIATGKVFSPQYLIWLIPLLVYAGGYSRPWLLLWGTISLLTSIIYPFLYAITLNGTEVAGTPGFLPSVILRDTLFVILTIAYLLNWFHLRQNQSDLLPAEEKLALSEEKEVHPGKA